MSTESQPSYPGTFVRKASGLVRTAGPIDVLAYNINFISIGLLLTFMFLFMPSLYPGVNTARAFCAARLSPSTVVRSNTTS